jgi:hypothetical protein
MDPIQIIAEDFVSQHICYDTPNANELINAAQTELINNNDRLDKIKFLNIVLEANTAQYERHKSGPTGCTSLTCGPSKAHTLISYRLGQELTSLGVTIDEDTFTVEEKRIADEKLQEILDGIKTIKNGQQIIYDELVKQINDLKDLQYLGKKKWYRQFAGTLVEMVANNVVDEAIVKPILGNLKNFATNLLS